MKFHREGRATLIITLLFSAMIILVSKFFLPFPVYVSSIFTSLFLLIIVLQFFRSPNRKIPTADAMKVYTPADGKVVVIEKTFESEFIKSECWQISVFMNPLNVHINRNPVGGTIEYLKYHPGKYLVAWHPKSSTENERFTTAYETDNGKVLIRQIAGALARRIVNFLHIGDKVNQCEEMGFIKFGSRVDIFLPLEAKIKVKLDQQVRSPHDILAEF